MLIYLYWNGEIETTFTDRDKEQIEKMCRDLDSEWYQNGNSLFRYETDEGPVSFFEDELGHLHGKPVCYTHDDKPESSFDN